MKRLVIECDRCGDALVVLHDAGAPTGWTQHDGLDICPGCQTGTGTDETFREIVADLARTTQPPAITDETDKADL